MRRVWAVTLPVLLTLVCRTKRGTKGRQEQLSQTGWAGDACTCRGIVASCTWSVLLRLSFVRASFLVVAAALSSDGERHFPST